MKKTTENTKLYKTKVGAGHFEIKAVFNYGGIEEEKSITTNDMTAFDDAFNCDTDNDCTSFETINEAKQYFIDQIFNK